MLAFFSNTAARVRRDEKGATAVEYGIMVALIAVVIIAAVTLLGGTMKETFTSAQCSIGGNTWEKPVAEEKNADGTIKVAAKAGNCKTS